MAVIGLINLTIDVDRDKLLKIDLPDDRELCDLVFTHDQHDAYGSLDLHTRRLHYAVSIIVPRIMQLTPNQSTLPRKRPPPPPNAVGEKMSKTEKKNRIQESSRYLVDVFCDCFGVTDRSYSQQMFVGDITDDLQKITKPLFAEGTPVYDHIKIAMPTWSGSSNQDMRTIQKIFALADTNLSIGIREKVQYKTRHKTFIMSLIVGNEMS